MPFNFPLRFSLKFKHVPDGRQRAEASAEVLPETRSMASKKTDRKFIADFSSVVERNISNDAFNVDQICAEMKIFPSRR